MKSKLVQLLLPLFKEVILALIDELKEWLEEKLKEEQNGDKK
jgi:hypothetical protein